MDVTIEQLEDSYWGEPNFDSNLVITCHNLRKKPLKDFTTEDLRIMIGQNMGLKYLIPMAIEILDKDILAEGDYYEGDLLKAILTSDKLYWEDNVNSKDKMKAIVKRNINLIEEFETTDEIRESLTEACKVFLES